MKIPEQDKSVLRDLAREVRILSESHLNGERTELWTKLNDLDGQRPMVLASPEGAWREIEKSWQIKCQSDWGKRYEINLRQRIYTFSTIKDDSTIEAVLDVPWHIQTGDYGVELQAEHTEQSTGAYKIKPPLTDLDRDLEKLQFRNLIFDRDASDKDFLTAQDVFGDILQVRHKASFWWTCGLTWEAIKLIGLTELMMLMYDNPWGLKKLMQFLSDEMLHFISWHEEQGLLSYNNGHNLIGSGNWGLTSELPSLDKPVAGTVRLNQMWGFAESQETVGISPEMFEEFVLPYQVPLAEKFGLNYYGCCEPLDTRMTPILRDIPRLRCLSISAWANEKKCAQLVGRDYVYCKKPDPTLICTGFNEDDIRKDIRKTLEAAGDLNLMFIMKDTHTIQNQPERIARWVEIVREETGHLS